MTYPWTYEWTNDVGPDDDYYIEFFRVEDANGKKIADVEEKIDAQLICAAPELLEVLEYVVNHHEPKLANLLFGEGWVNKAREVIAKARSNE